MGVNGLWKLVEPCGKPVPVETLEGKVLAVDISIWLHQVIKGFQDNKGAALNNAHILGLFHRLCKLMYYRVKPVFVFDGCVPQLKMDTIARRQQQRSKLNSEADRIQALLLQSLAKEKIVQQALGPNAELLLISPVKKLGPNKATRKDDAIDDMFKLPEMPSSSKANEIQREDITVNESVNDNSLCSSSTSASADDSSFDESNPRYAYNLNIQAIDVKSKDFLQLPADVRHEILVDIKETRKQSSWGRLHELPSHSDDFSNFQMKRLLKRRDVQVSLETAEQEMGGHTLTYAELTNIFSEEGILDTNIVEKGTKQIISDEHTRFILVKDLKKKLSKVEKESIQRKNEDIIKKEQNASIPGSSGVKSLISVARDEKLCEEIDTDLELAIALSLEEDSNRVYDEKDYEYDSDENIKLSKAQRQRLQNAAKGPARTYMIEYAGMNKEEVSGLLEKTQINADFDETDIKVLVSDGYKTEDEIKEPAKDASEEQLHSESQDIRLCVTDESDETDSDLEEVLDNNSKCSDNSNAVEMNDFEEVKEAIHYDLEDIEGVKVVKNKVPHKAFELEEECVIEETPPPHSFSGEQDVKASTSKTLNIKIDLSRPLGPEDDLFADIFGNTNTEAEKEIKYTPIFKGTNNFKQAKTSISPQKETKGLAETTPLITNEDKLSVDIRHPAKSKEMLSILDELKQQADDIKNIKLENIKISNSVIEVFDDETDSKSSKINAEVIEIFDSDENEKRCLTPPLQINNSTKKLNSKSPSFTTPSKNHSITDFYNVNYVIKRTPDKPEGDEQIPKVKSPFFVCKSPKSRRKSVSNSPSPKKNPSKANKNLFEEEILKDSGDKLDNGFIPLEDTRSVSEQDVLNIAANTLKSQKTVEELSTIASGLAKERHELENERNRQDRMGISVTQRMNSDCQDLLRLFGIPFIIAPMEAEAQCAFLEIVDLTNGTITDDSDIWLFGGRTVYKNFFSQNKHVMEFRSDQIEKDFNCDRKKLIQLACLVGSDYTTGIHGIGAVTALEILASFTLKETSNTSDDSTIISTENVLTTLQRFRNWWKSFKSAAAPPGSSARLALQKKLKNIELHEGFPNTAVVDAYLTPKVDQNKDAFSWGYPDVESLREFTKKKFGWTIHKTDEILMPVLKKLNEKRTQQSIRNYFNVKNALNIRQIRVSKRVQNAIDKMSGNIDSDDPSEKPTKTKRARKTKTASYRNKSEESVAALSTVVNQVNEVNCGTEYSFNNQTARGPVKRANKRINIPETKQVIPQREKVLAQMDANKKFAAEIFKNSANASKKKC